MRIVAIIYLLILSFGFPGTKNTALQSGKLDGTWVPVKQEIGGNTLPATIFEKQKLVISDSTYTFSAESIDKGIVKTKR